MDWTWLWDQAKQASPFVAVFCLGAWAVDRSVLWRRHVQDIKTIESMARSTTRAMLAQAKSTARLSSSVQRLLDNVRNGQR